MNYDARNHELKRTTDVLTHHITIPEGTTFLPFLGFFNICMSTPLIHNILVMK